MSASGGVMFSEQDWQTITSKFEFHWVLNTSGFVSQIKQNFVNNQRISATSYWKVSRRYYVWSRLKTTTMSIAFYISYQSIL